LHHHNNTASEKIIITKIIIKPPELWSTCNTAGTPELPPTIHQKLVMVLRNKQINK
jgi:hypothetical protein